MHIRGEGDRWVSLMPGAFSLDGVLVTGQILTVRWPMHGLQGARERQRDALLDEPLNRDYWTVTISLIPCLTCTGS